jgi:uncharacterized protein (DUF305 family)
MANKEINEGSNADVIATAKKIKASQEKDLANLKKFTINSNQGQSRPEFLAEIQEHIEKSRLDMESKMTMTGNLDKDFISFMTLHHQQGQELGRIHLKYGKNSTLKQMAQKMINLQKLQNNQLVSMSSGIDK